MVFPYDHLHFARNIMEEQASLVTQMVKNLPAMQETWVWSLHSSVCSPACCYAVSLIINFISAFAVSASMVKTFFTEGKDLGRNNSWPLAPAGVVARILLCIQASQAPFLGRELDLTSCQHSLLPCWDQLNFCHNLLYIIWIFVTNL